MGKRIATSLGFNVVFAVLLSCHTSATGGPGTSSTPATTAPTLIIAPSDVGNYIDGLHQFL